MAVMSFARFTPRSATVNPRTLAASGGMLILPCFMRPTNPSTGALATTGLIFELFGVVLTQVARVYMGRSFGILPANRGIVCKGHFRWVRHPIYFRLADTFDRLRDVLCERAQYNTDRCDAPFHGLANQSGRTTFDRRS